jgi:hypothetical protein
MLDLLGLFFVQAEQVGQYPRTARYVITTLIPKADGGLRPINLFSAVYRLHSRCRSGLLRHWAQTAGKHAMVNMASGRHTNDGVYRLLMKRAVTHSTDEAASVLWDIQKALENVHRDRLVHMARRFGYPIRWLRLSLASYAWPRTLEVEHAAGSTVIPQLGIWAGAMSATYELHVYVLAMLYAHQQSLPQVGLSIHVDDIIRDFSGTTETILDDVAQSNLLVQRHLRELGLSLAASKGQIVASSDILARQVSTLSLGAGSTG